MRIQDLIVKLSSNLYKLFGSLKKMKREEKSEIYKVLKNTNDSIKKVLEKSTKKSGA